MHLTGMVLAKCVQCHEVPPQGCAYDEHPSHSSLNWLLLGLSSPPMDVPFWSDCCQAALKPRPRIIEALCVSRHNLHKPTPCFFKPGVRLEIR